MTQQERDRVSRAFLDLEVARKVTTVFEEFMWSVTTKDHQVSDEDHADLEAALTILYRELDRRERAHVELVKQMIAALKTPAEEAGQ
jgi:hypothetical protein